MPAFAGMTTAVTGMPTNPAWHGLLPPAGVKTKNEAVESRPRRVSRVAVCGHPIRRQSFADCWCQRIRELCLALGTHVCEVNKIIQTDSFLNIRAWEIC
jgi:hypothetical protein